ncbi:DUF4288 domain-containing protein [Chitinivorax sp. B]|uniref:DUF4288 domain-containing protein n=1 Tax=Chitinivorax sp. B TaxID=2502235 RepID=UPI0010F8B8F6|nr:DUF4288 domain-containing protein [Chitinivorax sp. B]
MTWYAAHVVLQVQFKEGKQDRFPVWENIYLINAETDEDALSKAESIGASLEGDRDGSFFWDDIPSRWVYRGVRKILEISNPWDVDNRPGDGCEVTFETFEFSDVDNLKRFVNCEESFARIPD